MKLMQLFNNRRFRRAYDRICGEGVLIAIICAVFWLIGYSITYVCEHAVEIMTAVIDWCGEHAALVAIVMVAMIAACVVIDWRIGE